MQPNLPQRKSPRLQGYDYSSAGLYFVTICTFQRQHLFGEVQETTMHLNEVGGLAAQDWLALPAHYTTLTLDEYVIMPNHIHGILYLDPTTQNAPMLGTIIGTYKAGVSRKANSILPGKIWQGRYHDHIIRHEKVLNYIRDYVIHNPARWQKDVFYEG